ncbi:MAG TPA: alpha/beta hydrolase [Solirubrobacteraceae bacterium]|nr:alpha/beta hydrolase [Solirubrobacteraceae bacterium]
MRAVANVGRCTLGLAVMCAALAPGRASAALAPGRASAAAPARAPARTSDSARAHAAKAPSRLELGTQTLARCQARPLAYCGTLAVPLDYSATGSPDISVAYRFYPAREPAGGHAAGTVVPVEGGPGYPSIESVSYEDDGGVAGYSAMYGALLDDRNMLVLDNRGTGESTPIECPALQSFTGATDSAAFQLAAAGCAAGLNHRWRYADGRWVHASDLFTSAPAAEDMAAVIEALALGKVDLYGDSYGSFFAQAFAARYPQLLRSVILDSTYQTIGLDPWYRSSIEAMPNDFDLACSRWPACAQAEGEPAFSRIGELAARLRAAPVEALVPGPEGALESASMNSVGLVNLLSDAAGDPRIYRELDAAARALLEADDPAPLLRLYQQRLDEDEAYFEEPVSEYSVGLYLAVSCLDYPQLFQMSSAPPQRRAQLAAAEAALAPGSFAPFSTREWLEQDQNTEAFTACLDWPRPRVAQPPVPGSPPLLPASLPVLVLGGELDTWTPPAEVPTVLAQLGAHARFVELANSTHVVGEGDTACGSQLVQRFVAEPQALDTLDAACAAAVPPIHAVGVYAASLAEEAPLEGAGAPAPAADLRLAAAAVSTAGDAISRYQATEATIDHGLAGGTVKAGHHGTVLKLKGDELVPGVAVSGTVRLAPPDALEEGQSVQASLAVKASGFSRASFTANWSTAGAGARAQVAGSVGAQPVEGSMPAP